jgi:hypothetical protein
MCSAWLLARSGLQHSRCFRRTASDPTNTAFVPGPLPGLHVAVRQQMLNYGTNVALRLLSSHIHSITIPSLSRTISVPVLGDVSLHISRVQTTKFDVIQDAVGVLIEDKVFKLTAEDVTANFKYHWKWEAVSAKWLHGTGGAIDPLLRILRINPYNHWF